MKPSLLEGVPQLSKQRRKLIPLYNLATMRHLNMLLISVSLFQFSLCFPVNSHCKGKMVRVPAGERSDDRNTVYQAGKYSASSRHDKPSEPSEVSMSPNPESPLFPSANSTRGFNPAAMEPGLPPWISTMETIITVIFRTVMMILTLINVNVSWKIHGMHQDSPNYCS